MLPRVIVTLGIFARSSSLPEACSELVSVALVRHTQGVRRRTEVLLTVESIQGLQSKE